MLAVVWVGVLGWLRPFTAGPDALAALHSDRAVAVIDHPTSIEFIPAVPAPTRVGLVFSPGARVDSRAYAALLRPAAEAGYLVVILKEPFGLAITQVGQSAGPIADHPEITHWAVGGHSLGGVSAARFAADHLDTVDGLLLWASFPDGDMSADDTLQVESIFGSNDLLATPADIERSKSKLPPDSTYTEIDGGVHCLLRAITASNPETVSHPSAGRMRPRRSPPRRSPSWIGSEPECQSAERGAFAGVKSGVPKVRCARITRSGGCGDARPVREWEAAARPSVTTVRAGAAERHHREGVDPCLCDPPPGGTEQPSSRTVGDH